MNISDIIYKNNMESLANFVPLTNIQTEDDKKPYEERGYNILFTEKEWSSRFSIPPQNMYYSNGLTPSMYYAELDHKPVPIIYRVFFLDKDKSVFNDDQELEKALFSAVNTLKSGGVEEIERYLALLDGKLRIEVLTKFLKNSEPSPELYSMLIDFYLETDYGFDALPIELVEKLAQKKSEEQKANTQEALDDFLKGREQFLIYRGQGSNSTPLDKALSWTLSMNTAYFFACRRGFEGAAVYIAKVNRADVIEYIHGTEKEILVLPKNVHVLQCDKIYGVNDDALKLSPELLQVYRCGEKLITTLYDKWLKKSSKADVLQAKRVMLLVMEIFNVGQFPLSVKLLENLMSAAVFRDIGKDNGASPSECAERSSWLYNKLVKPEEGLYNPKVEMLVRNYCLGDVEFMEKLRDSSFNSIERAEILQIYAILKDAETLACTTSDPRTFDVNSLRIKDSKKLALVAVQLSKVRHIPMQ